MPRSHLVSSLRAGGAAVLLHVTLAACSDYPEQGSRTQLGPSPPPGGSGPVISGQVEDTTLRPLAGASVTIMDGRHAGFSTLTDSAGRYRLTGSFASGTRVEAQKDGYTTVRQTWTCSGSSCDRDPGPILSFVLNGLFPSIDISGDYTVTMSADPSCTDLPTAARERTYPAASHRSPTRDTSYGFALSGGTFHQGEWIQRLDAFSASVARDHVLLVFDGAPQPGVVEELPDHTYVAYGGIARTTTPATASMITADLDGWIEFCALKSPMEAGYECLQEQRAEPTPSRPVPYARCESRQHRVVLTRR